MRIVLPIKYFFFLWLESKKYKKEIHRCLWANARLRVSNRWWKLGAVWRGVRPSTPPDTPRCRRCRISIPIPSTALTPTQVSRAPLRPLSFMCGESVCICLRHKFCLFVSLFVFLCSLLGLRQRAISGFVTEQRACDFYWFTMLLGTHCIPPRLSPYNTP